MTEVNEQFNQIKLVETKTHSNADSITYERYCENSGRIYIPFTGKCFPSLSFGKINWGLVSVYSIFIIYLIF